MTAIIGPSWASFASRGLASAVFGLVALAWPRVTLLGLTILFGVYCLSDGMLAFVGAARRGHNPHRWLLALDGVFGLVTGLVVLLWPEIGLLALILLVGVRAILTGSLQITFGWKLRNAIRSSWLYALAGALTFALGVVALAVPGVTAMVLVMALGIYAVVFGTSLLAIAFVTRRSGERIVAEAWAS